MPLSKSWQTMVLSYVKNWKSRRKSLKEFLTANNQSRWLDLGSSSSFNEGFFFADLHPPNETPEIMRRRYFQLNILHATEQEIESLGRFHLIRMQHVFEHFTPEDGLIALERCADLLHPNGYILITVPDLKIFINKYRNKSIHNMQGFRGWALTRIPENAPESFYFSVFTHSVPHQQHLWCYDEEGLKYQLNRTGKFKNIQRLSLFHPFSSVPFTHNRPEEDLCILAQKA